MSFLVGHKTLRTKESYKRMAIKIKNHPNCIKNQFKKGHVPWIKGRKNIWANLEGLKKGHGWNKGKKMNYSEEHIKKIIQTAKKYARPWPKGTSFSEEHKNKIKKGIKRYYDLKGRVSDVNKIIRSSSEYKKWRKSVFERDNYICQFCNKKGGKLVADHIKPFAFYPEDRFDLSNGRTLCFECHKKTDTYLNRWFVSRNKIGVGS